MPRSFVVVVCLELFDSLIYSPFDLLYFEIEHLLWQDSMCLFVSIAFEYWFDLKLKT